MNDAPKKFSNPLLDMLKKQQAEKAPQQGQLAIAPKIVSAAQSAIKPALPTAKPSQLSDLLKGTGLTKKEAAKADTDHKTADQSLSLAAKLAKAKAPAFGKTTHIQIPTVNLTGDHTSLADQKLEQDDSQDAAVNGCIREQFSCLIGAAGTGKTTVTLRIVRAIENRLPLTDLKELARKHAQRFGRLEDDEELNAKDAKQELVRAMCFTAFTGRAVEQMKRRLPPEFHPLCQTIHSHLGYAPDYYVDEETGEDKMQFVPTFGEHLKLPYLVYFIDEAGMLGTQLWNNLRAAMLPEAMVIMIGDINQLPPVHDKSILAFAMANWPVFELTKVHRTAEGSPIIENAHNILNGRFPKAFTGQFDMVPLSDGSIEAFRKVIAQIKVLHQNKKFDARNDGVIVAYNGGNLGQQTFNEALVPYFNPPREEQGIVVNRRMMIQTGTGTVAYAVGDKIMSLANGNGVTNGMVGFISEINLNPGFKGKAAVADSTETEMEGFDLDSDDFFDQIQAAAKDTGKDETERQASHIVTAKFWNGTKDIEVKMSTSKAYKNIAPAYVFTCHKSQGGEYPTVIGVIHSANAAVLSREWLYTLVTRTQTRCILMFNNRGLAQALKRQHIVGKTLKEKIASFFKLVTEGEDGKQRIGNLEINLPEPKHTTLWKES